MASYSVQYLFSLVDRFSPGAKKMGASAKSMSGSVHSAGKASNLLTGALGRLGKATTLTAKKTAALGRSTKTAATGANALAGGAKKAATGVSAIGKAATAALAPLKALQAQMLRVSRTALYNRGLIAMGGYEAANTKRGAQYVMAARNKDKALRDAYLAGGGGGGKRGGFFRAAGRLGGRGFSPMVYGGGSRGMLAMGAGYAKYSALRNFADFEAAEIAIQAIGQKLGQSKSDLAAMSVQARKLGASTIFEPQDIIQGQLLFLKAGRSAREAIAALPNTLNLAAVADIDVAKATETALNLMAQGRIPAEKLGETMDALTATFLNSKSELLPLAQAANYAVPILTQLGVPIEQQFAAMGALAEGGQSGTRGARALRQVFTTLQKVPFDKKKAGLLKEFGVNLDKYFDKGKVTDFVGLIEAFGQAEERSGNTLLARLFPANAITGMQTMIAQIETLRRVLGAVPAFKGVNADLAQTKFRGLSGAVRQLGAAWSELGIAFGKSGVGAAVENAVRGVSEAFTSMSTALDAGAFLEQLFDPAMLLGRIHQLSVRLGLALARGLLGAVQSAMNAVSESLGTGRLGDWFREWFDFDEKFAEVEERLARIDKTLTSRAGEINQRGFAAASAAQQKLMVKRHGAATPDGYRRFIDGVDFGGLRAAAPPPSYFGTMPSGASVPMPDANPNRVPQAAAERVQIENSVKVQTDFAPATVNVTGRLEGLAGIAALVRGSGTLQANRGTASSEAGAASSAPAP